MIIVEHGFGDAPALTYILDLILGERLGLPYRVRQSDVTGICLSYENRVLRLPSPFLARFTAENADKAILPDRPLKCWDAGAFPASIRLTNPIVPVIFGAPEVNIGTDEINLGIDVFGSAFFMLSRYEETVMPDRDHHDRFPAAASIAMQENFLERPIVDEYIEILWACMTMLWPGMERRKSEFKVRVSCDVDRAYSCGRKTLPALVRQIGSDVIRHRRPGWAMRNSLNYIYAKSGSENCRFDPYYTRIDWMMDVGEATGNPIAFYFICGHSSTKDGCYLIGEPIVRQLFRQIHQRGHEIGLHPSYNTYLDPVQLRREADNLRTVLEEENIDQDTIGGRQHYLRWDAAQTPRTYEALGLAYDTTLSYAEQAGFRCGTCHEYTLFDIGENRALDLRERPLIVMEVSVFSEDYMNMGRTENALDFMLTMKQTCRQFDGEFTLLWHNENFHTKADEEFFATLLS